MNHERLDPNWKKHPSYSFLLQKQGYQTAHIGKWHMARKAGKEQIRPGFDYWFSFLGQGKYRNPIVNENGKEYKIRDYIRTYLQAKQ